MSYFVGIDPSITNTGGVVLDAEGKLVHCFNTKHRPSTDKAKGIYAGLLRYQEITDYVISNIELCLPNKSGLPIICYENYSYDSQNLAFTIGELGGVLKLGLVKSFGNIILIEPKKLKKFATGSGSSGKKSVVNKACEESDELMGLGKKQMTDDVCDAYFLAKFAWYIAQPKLAAKFDLNNDLLRERLSMAKFNYRSMKDDEREHLGDYSAFASGSGRGADRRKRK